MSRPTLNKESQFLTALRTENLQLRQELQKLRAENQRMKHSLLQHTMERAVLDDQMSPDLSIHMEQFFSPPLSPWYVCIVFYGCIPSDTVPITSPLDSIAAALTDTLSSFGQPFFFSVSGLVSCLLNVPLPKITDPSISGESFCRQIQAALIEQLSNIELHTIVNHIAISSLDTMAEGPRALYRSANNASEHKTAEQKVCTAYDYTLPAPAPGQHLYTLEQIFWQQIQQREFYKAAATLDQILQIHGTENSFLERDLPAVFSRMERVIDSVVQNAAAGVSSDSHLAHLLHRLSYAKTYQELRESAYDIFATLEDQFYTPANARNRKLPQIEHYIRTNYMDPTLCTASIAAEFRISPAYLSRIFKADLGVGLAEYLHRIRVDAAKTELRRTHHTLDKIAAHVGFSTRSLFIRVFKKYENMTPGAYRAAQTVPKTNIDT